jgi:hypothetical protein
MNSEPLSQSSDSGDRGSGPTTRVLSPFSIGDPGVFGM